MYFVFPALRMESRAGIEDSRGVSAYWSMFSMLVHSIIIYRRTLTRIDAVEVIEVRSESKTFDRSFDVRFDVLGGVGHGHVAFEC
jgi:hypothetical protein